MRPQSGKQTTAIHVLPSVSRRKENQTIKFAQLKEYNLGNIFV